MNERYRAVSAKIGSALALIVLGTILIAPSITTLSMAKDIKLGIHRNFYKPIISAATENVVDNLALSHQPVPNDYLLESMSIYSVLHSKPLTGVVI